MVSAALVFVVGLAVGDAGRGCAPGSSEETTVVALAIATLAVAVGSLAVSVQFFTGRRGFILWCGSAVAVVVLGLLDMVSWISGCSA